MEIEVDSDLGFLDRKVREEHAARVRETKTSKVEAKKSDRGVGSRYCGEKLRQLLEVEVCMSNDCLEYGASWVRVCESPKCRKCGVEGRNWLQG